MIRLSIIILLTLVACRQSERSGIDNHSDALGTAHQTPKKGSPEVVEDAKKKEMVIRPDQIRSGLFKDLTDVTEDTLKNFQMHFLNELIKNGDGEFESDSAYTIESVQEYVIDSVDTIFYIKGQFLPSTVDFHFYGGYNGVDDYLDVFHLPVQTSFYFTKYQISDVFIRVYGKRNDNNSESEGEKLLFQLDH